MLRLVRAAVVRRDGWVLKGHSAGPRGGGSVGREVSEGSVGLAAGRRVDLGGGCCRKERRGGAEGR